MNNSQSIKILVPLILLANISLFGQGNRQTSNAANAIEIEEPGRSSNTSEWYTNQKVLWDQNRSTSIRDANAWYNYYKAYRFSNYTSDSKVLSQKKLNELNRVVSEMEKTIPDSYEYNYIKYWNGNYNLSLFPYLQKAYEMEPDKVELYDDFIAYYELTGDLNKKKEFCQIWYKSNDIPEQIFQYNYNVLMSLDKNAILITNGSLDTYPIWILQDIKNLRKDVTVIFIDLLPNKDYTNKMFSSLGIVAPSIQYTSSEKHKYLGDLVRLNPQSPIYFGLTVEPSILKYFNNNLYITGLALKYSNIEINNIDILHRNYVKKFEIAYLFSQDNPSIEGNDLAVINKININYILPMLVLYEYYLENGDQVNANEIKKNVLNLAKQGNIEDQIKIYLDKF
ncbi:hypothetical protein ACFLRZ_04395 [Bacteroidota bacterium]